MKTNRGFERNDFKDIYGHSCSIQESSLATIDALWIGCDEGTHVDGSCMARMHIDKDIAKMLIKKLRHFVRTGRLPEDS